jgi:hypothetical protein
MAMIAMREGPGGATAGDDRKMNNEPLEREPGTDWQFVTLGRFFGSDTTDMLLRNSSTGVGIASALKAPRPPTLAAPKIAK